MSPSQLFKCLSDDTRLRIMLLITAEEELCVCELTTALADSQPKISRHLGHLRNCALVSDRRQGQWVFYRLDANLPAWAVEILHVTRHKNPALLRDLEQRLLQMGDRPSRAARCC